MGYANHGEVKNAKGTLEKELTAGSVSCCSVGTEARDG